MSDEPTNPILDIIHADLAALKEYNIASMAAKRGVSAIMELIRDDDQPLVGGLSEDDPNLVEVYGEQPFKDIFQIYAKGQGKGVTLRVENLADFRETPTVYLEGQEAHDFVMNG